MKRRHWHLALQFAIVLFTSVPDIQAEVERGLQLAPLTRAPATIVNDVIELNKLGATIVRYPIYLAGNPDLNAWISNLNLLLPVTDSFGMTVAVTFLWPDRNHQGSHIYDTAQFVNDWGSLSNALKNYKNVRYDLTNEPDNSNWSSIALQAAQRIRTNDTVHPIVYAIKGTKADPVETSYSPLPGISNQQLEVHFYDWYPAYQSSPDANNPLKLYNTGIYTRSNLFKILTDVYNTKNTYGVRAYVGETAVNIANVTSSAFLADFTQFASVLGLDLTLHAFREAPIWDYEGNPNTWAEVLRWLNKYDANLDQLGTADPITWEQSTSTWYYRLTSENLQTVHATQWGLPTDKPFVGKFNADSQPDFVVFRDTYPPTWYLNYDYTKGYGQTQSWESVQWGLAGDVAAPVDFNKNGRSQIAVFRPSNGTWYIRLDASNSVTVSWGISGDIPYPDDYDMDGYVDIAVWRTSGAQARRYYFIPSSGVCPWGTSVHGMGCEQIL